MRTRPSAVSNRRLRACTSAHNRSRRSRMASNWRSSRCCRSGTPTDPNEVLSRRDEGGARPQAFEQAFLSAGARLERSEEHTSELQSREKLVCRLLLEKKK